MTQQNEVGNQPAVGIQYAPQPENTALQSTTVQTLAPMEVQSPDNIVPVRPKFVDDARDAELKRQANDAVEMVLSNPMGIQYTAAIYNLGDVPVNQNTENVGLMETKISVVMKDLESGSTVGNTLTEIKTKLDLINPAVVGRTETSFPKKLLFGAIAWTTKRIPRGDEVLLLINERKDTIASTIEGLKLHLFAEKDKALRNAIELSLACDRLFVTQNQLQEAVYVGQMIWRGLNNALVTETDPIRLQALRTLVSDLAIKVVDIQTVDTLNVQTRMAAETLIANARKIEQGVKRMVTVLLPAVATNLMVKAAAAQQLSTATAMNDMARAAEETIRDTQEQVGQASVEMEKMQSKGLINPKVLEEVADEAVRKITELDQLRAETESNARRVSASLTKVSDKLRGLADGMTGSRLAIDAAK